MGSFEKGQALRDLELVVLACFFETFFSACAHQQQAHTNAHTYCSK